MIARWLTSRGHIVRLAPLTKAPTRADWKDHVDDGDLEIALRVEVKRLSANFTNAKDWPFGSKFIVCAKHAFDNARPKPHSFIIVNAAGTHAAIVEGRTSRDWTVERKTDSRMDGVSQECYLAPMGCVTFTTLADR